MEYYKRLASVKTWLNTEISAYIDKTGKKLSSLQADVDAGNRYPAKMTWLAICLN